MRSAQTNVDPGEDLIPVTKSDTLDVFGVAIQAANVKAPACRALLVGTAGTATVVMASGQTRTSVPLQAGYNPISVRQVKNAGTAADIWAIP